MLNRNYDEHPDTRTVNEEVRDCGPLDSSDLEERLGKQYPKTELGRVTPGIAEGDNQGQNAATTQQNGPLDSTYKPRPWGGDGHKQGDASKTAQGLRNDWIGRREKVNTGERAAIGRANVPRKA